MFHSEASNIPPDFVWLSDDFPQDPEAYGRIASACRHFHGIPVINVASEIT